MYIVVANDVYFGSGGLLCIVDVFVMIWVDVDL